ncbi:hypothetical protein [Acinetobacter baumannii]|uniref:hypothetical protein n=1 Tax=Acinetobacter baumannii TaxID=470 RepID=UPI000A26EE32|nr:hypothetical protein [Acinetobacter baumannii]
MIRKQFNSNFVEKFCLVLITFIASSITYYLGFKGFKSFFVSTEVLNFKDTVTFGLSVSSLVLALILYSDWREKYVAESLDKDFREIKAHVSDLNFIINRFPSSDSESDVNERAEFFKIFWKLRVLNSNIKYSSLYTLNSQIEEYLNTSHGFINAMLRKSGGEYSEIQKESKLLFDSLNESIELARKNNLKT